MLRADRLSLASCLVIFVTGCYYYDPKNGLWSAQAVARAEYYELNGVQIHDDSYEWTGYAGYWAEHHGLYLAMINQETGGGLSYETLAPSYTYTPPELVSIRAHIDGISTDCAVFWPEGAAHETMNVIDGFLFAHLTIDTRGVPEEAPPECVTRAVVRIGIEGVEPLTFVADPNISFE